MNAFKFVHFSQHARWVGIAMLCAVVGACNEPTSQEQTLQSQEHAGEGVVLANNDGTIPEVQGLVATTALRISLPSDQSSFLPGPDLGPLDTTLCNSCHSPAEITEFSAPPGPRFKLVKEQCGDCHSADYTSSQPILTRPAWQKVVVKMADKFGANRIRLVENGIVKDHPHQALMLDYLVAVYGTP